MEREEGKGWSSKLEGYSLHQKKEEGKRQEEEQELVLELCENYAVVPLFFLNFSLFIVRPPVLGTTLNCIIMPHDYYDNTWHVLMVKIPCIGYNL